MVARPCRRRRPSSLDDGGISGKLVRIALVVEKLGEVGLVTFHVSDMDERDSLSKMPRSIGESLDRINRIDKIIFNAEAQRAQRHLRFVIYAFFLTTVASPKVVADETFPVP